MAEALVSMIVPVYKVEDLLGRCIDSMLAQYHKNLEIILVDDGSPDNCGQIIDDYYEKYPDVIRPLHQENQGAGQARNNGLKMATGEWVCFIDSDDYIEQDYVSTMLAIAEEKEADIVVSNLYLESPGGRKIIFPLIFTKPVLDGDKAARKSLNLLSIPNFAWNKLYRRALLEEINFAFPSLYFEDVAIAAKTLYSAGTVAFTNRPLYHYCQRKDGQVGSFNEKKLGQSMEAIEMVGEFLNKTGEMDKWYRSWKRLLFHVKVQFTVQIYLQMRDKSFGEKRKILKKLNQKLKEIDRKYRYNLNIEEDDDIDLEADLDLEDIEREIDLKALENELDLGELEKEIDLGASNVQNYTELEKE